MGLSRFLAPRVVDSWQAVLQGFRDVQAALDRVTRSNYVQGLAVQDLQLACPGFYRVSPPLLGIRATIPRASEDNASERICLSIEGALGSIIIFAPPGQTIAGSATATFSANGLIELYSNGVNAWALVNQLPVGSPGSPPWKDTLSVNAHSGAFNPLIDSGQFIGFGDAASAALLDGDVRAGVLATSGVFKMRSDDDVYVQADHVLTLQGSTGDVDVVSGAQVHLEGTTGVRVDSNAVVRLVIDNTGAWKMAGTTPGNAGQYLRSSGAGTSPLWASLAYSELPTIASDTFLGNVSGLVAAPVAVNLSSLASTSLVFTAHTFVTAAVTGAVTIAQNGTVSAFGALAAKSVLANATNASAVPAALSGSASFQHLRVNAANTGLEWSLLTAGDFPANIIPIGALPQIATDTFLGNISGVTAGPSALPISGLAGSGLAFASHALLVSTNTSLLVSGGTVVRAALTGAVTAAQDSNATAFGVLAAKSVLANATNASAVPAALAGSAAFQHLRVNAANTALEWSVLTTGDFPAGSVPITALAAFPTLAQVCAAGNHTGANTSIVIDNTGALGIAGATATTLNIQTNGATNDCLMTSSGKIEIRPTTTLGLQGADILFGSTNTPKMASLGLNFTNSLNPATPTPAANSGSLFCNGTSANPRLLWRTNSTQDWPADCAGMAGTQANTTITAAVTNIIVASSVIFANALDVGSMFKWEAHIVGVAPAAPPTLTCEILIGATVVASSVISQLASGGTSGGWVKGMLAFTVIGASGKAIANCGFIHSGAASFANAVAASTNVVVNAGTFNTTANLTLLMQVRMTTAVAAASLTVSMGSMSRVR